MKKTNPSKGLEQHDDPNAQPIENFMPEDEKHEWKQYVDYFQGKNESFYGNTTNKQISVREMKPWPEKSIDVKHLNVFKIKNAKTGEFYAEGMEWETFDSVCKYISSNFDFLVEDIEIVAYHRTISTIEVNRRPVTSDLFV